MNFQVKIPELVGPSLRVCSSVGIDLGLKTCATASDGQKIEIRNVPTRFGLVSYKIVSHLREGYIEALIESPTRNAPQHIVIRIRHPDDKRMKSVTVDGRLHADFAPATETVRLTPAAHPLKLKVEF